MIVVDATVICYFVISGEHTDSVRRLREWDSYWSAPELWKSEVMNVLWKSLSRDDLSLDLAFQHFDLARTLIGATAFEPRPHEVLPLALDSGRSAYDCQYVALAKRLGVPFATHDKPLQKAFPSVAHSPEALINT